jgi:hypothetical protein
MVLFLYVWKSTYFERSPRDNEMGDMLCVYMYVCMYVCLRRGRFSSLRYALDICDSNDTLAPTGVGSRFVAPSIWTTPRTILPTVKDRSSVTTARGIAAWYNLHCNYSNTIRQDLMDSGVVSLHIKPVFI